MVCILLSHERSGSHLVGEFLQHLDGVSVLDEVCNSIASADYEFSFHRFQLEYAERHRDAYLTRSYRQHLDFIDAYFAHVASADPDRQIVVDLKYGHLHNFEWFWSPPLRPPLVFSWVQSNGGRIVHLSRNNPIEAVVSAEVARQRGVWHSWQSDATSAAGPRHRIDTDRVAYEARLLRRQTTLIREEWLGSVDCFDLRYENFVESLSADRQTLSELAAFLGGSGATSWTPKLKKLGRPLPDLLENYSELKDSCSAAGLGEFLQD